MAEGLRTCFFVFSVACCVLKLPHSPLCSEAFTSHQGVRLCLTEWYCVGSVVLHVHTQTHTPIYRWRDVLLWKIKCRSRKEVTLGFQIIDNPVFYYQCVFIFFNLFCLNTRTVSVDQVGVFMGFIKTWKWWWRVTTNQRINTYFWTGEGRFSQVGLCSSGQSWTFLLLNFPTFSQALEESQNVCLGQL